jgi:hypothetical protein
VFADIALPIKILNGGAIKRTTEKAANPWKYRKNPVTIAVTGFFDLAQKEGFEPCFFSSKTLVAQGIVVFGWRFTWRFYKTPPFFALPTAYPFG